jgi:hypothetical protein
MGMSLVVQIVGQQTLLPADVGRAGLDLAEDGFQQPLLLHFLGQGEGVAAAYADGLCLADHTPGIFRTVYGTYLDAVFRKTGLHFRFVFGVGKGDACIRDENHFADTSEELVDAGHRVFQIGFSGVRGVGN